MALRKRVGIAWVTLSLLAAGAWAELPETVQKSIQNLNDPNPETRAAAAQALGRSRNGDSEVIRVLTAALQDSDGTVRAEAAASLGDIGKQDFSAISSLSTLANGSLEKSETRVNAAYALVMMDAPGKEQAFKELLRQFQDDKSGNTQTRGRSAARKLGNAAIDPIQRAVDGKELPVTFGEELLQSIGTTEAYEARRAMDERAEGHQTSQTGYRRYRSRNPDGIKY